MDHTDGSPNTASDPRLLRLDPRDNVLCVTRALASGAVLEVEGQEVALSCDFAHGDKLASHAIAAGSPVLKYGQIIGTATQDVARGEWVHVHNLKSNYLPTFLHGTQDRFFHGAGDGQERESAT